MSAFAVGLTICARKLENGVPGGGQWRAGRLARPGSTNGSSASLPRHGLQQCLGKPPAAYRLYQAFAGRVHRETNRLFRSLRATPNHVLIIDRLYVDAMEIANDGMATPSHDQIVRHMDNDSAPRMVRNMIS